MTRIYLMGKFRIESDDNEAEVELTEDEKQLLALMILGKHFLPEDVARQDDEVSREWLRKTLLPEMFEQNRQASSDRVRYLLDQLDQALSIRRQNRSERVVIQLSFDHLWIDILELEKAARDIHQPAQQREIITLGQQSLLIDIEALWMRTPPFQAVRARLDGYYLDAFSRQADSILFKFEHAIERNRLTDAENLRHQAIALLDLAQARLRLAQTNSDYFLIFRNLRRRARYTHADDLGEKSPASSLEPAAHNLLIPITEFFGRQSEWARVNFLLSRERLVTLTGFGGCGKTRLAKEIAREVLSDGWHGVWQVELAEIQDPSRIPWAIAAALSIEVRGDVTNAIITALKSRRSLLLIDNCEHLLAACCEVIERLLQTCPELKILATSRARLNIDGESLCRISPLPFASSAQAALDSPAERLFLNRAAQQREFRLTPANSSAVTEICRALDGIPLALELAAARTRTSSITQIANLLPNILHHLNDGRRNAASHHRTLTALIDWSFELLTDQEKFLLSRLSVFAGGWTTEAAAYVSDCGAEEVQTLLNSLVEYNLVVAEPEESPERYRLFETVRQYTLKKLQQSGEEPETRRRHRAYLLQLANACEAHLKGPEPRAWVERLKLEIDNLRAVMAGQNDETTLCLATALHRFWVISGYLQEGAEWLEQAANCCEEAPIGSRIRAWNAAGNLKFNMGNIQQAQGLHQHALMLAQQTGDAQCIADSFNRLGVAIALEGDYEQAGALIDQSLALWREIGEAEGTAAALNHASMVAAYTSDYTLASRLMEESLALSRPLNDIYSQANGLHNLGILAVYQRDFATAYRLFEESLAHWRTIGSSFNIANSLGGLGEVAIQQGDYEAGQRFYAESLALKNDVGDKYGVANSLNGIGEAKLYRGDLQAARQYFTESLSLRRQIGERQSIPASLYNLGEVALREADFPLAQSLFRESLTLMQENQDQYSIPFALEGLAATAALPQQGFAAICLLSAAEAMRTLMDNPLPLPVLAEYNRRLDIARHAVTIDVFEDAWSLGQTMQWEDAVVYANDRFTSNPGAVSQE